MKESFSAIIKRLNEVPDDENTEKELRKVMERVAWLCKNKPYVKGTYAGLIQAYWRKFHGIRISAETFELMIRAPSPESISRTFRILEKKAQGTEFETQFQASTDKARRRRIREGSIRRVINKLEAP